MILRQKNESELTVENNTSQRQHRIILNVADAKKAIMMLVFVIQFWRASLQGVVCVIICFICRRQSLTLNFC